MRKAIVAISFIFGLSFVACSPTLTPLPLLASQQPTVTAIASPAPRATSSSASLAPATPDAVAAAKAKSEAAILALAAAKGLDHFRVLTNWNQKTGLAMRVFSILQSTMDESRFWYAAHDQIAAGSDSEVSTLTEAPNISGLVRTITVNDLGEIVFTYKSGAGVEMASLNPSDKYHNRQLAWNWKQVLVSSEKSRVFEELFDSSHLTFANGLDTPDNKTWIASALMQWAPQVSELSLPDSQTIRSHYPDNKIPVPETMFEALSRIKVISPSDTNTSYGGVNGEIRLSRAARYDYPAEYQRVATPEEMQLFTFAIIVKESQVILWAQDHNLRGCSPTDVENPTEYYSTTWLVMMLSNLAPKLQDDKSYVVKTMIPFYENVLTANQFPPCGP